MTKEEIISIAKQAENQFGCYYIVGKLNEFFDSNVVIPKGKNRHPDADIIHLGVEGIVDLQQFCSGNWDYVNYTPHQGWKYRIKPSEPIYEYQWLDFGTNGGAYIMADTKYMTDDEAHSLCSYSEIKPIEETKRVRNNSRIKDA